MTTAILQTPLEVILFFTSLAANGVQPQTFHKISEILKADRDVRESDGYDEARLSPESLQQLYLSLLKDEVRGCVQSQKADPVPHAGGDSPNARKRKIASPVLQSLSDAQEHEHLIPVLVDKLYARYCENALQDIVKEEAKYFEIQKTTTGTGQEPQKEQDGAERATQRQQVSTKPLTAEESDSSCGQLPTPALPSTPVPAPTAKSHAGREQIPKHPVGSLVLAPDAATSQPARSNQSDFDASHFISRSPRSAQVSGLSKPLQATLKLSSQHGSKMADSSSPSTQLESARDDGLASVAPVASSIPGGPHARPQGQVSTTQNNGSSQSPFVAPGQSDFSLGPVSSKPSGQVPGSRTGPPTVGYTHSVIPPQSSPSSTALPPGQHQHVPRQNYRSGHQYVNIQNQPEALHSTPQPRPPVTNNFPYSSAGATGQRGGQSPVHPPIHPASRQKPHSGTPRQTLTPTARPPHTTPAPSTGQKAVLPKLDTSTPSTKWRGTSTRRERSPVRPQMSPMEPGSPGFGDSLDSEGSTIKVASKQGLESSVHTTSIDAEDTPSRPTVYRGRGGRGRGGGRGGRTGSATASARTRSQSTTSQPEELAAKNKQGFRRPNLEADNSMDETMLGAPESAAGTPSSFSTGKRRDTLRSIETPPLSSRPGQKRKRANTLDVGSPASPGSTTPKLSLVPTRPGFVLGVRNLPRIAATILNDVTTHKLASMFQKPITERDAPGYRDLVFQPQDIKTIRSQLQAGQRAIIAADATGQEPGDATTPGAVTGVSKATSTIWLERSADILPPKAIVNSSQLETELCRIFANAVMFNPDTKRGVGPAFRTRAKRAEAQRQGKNMEEADDSEDESDDWGGRVVNEAREMFADVEKQLAGWRAAERTSSGGGLGLDGTEDDDQPMYDAQEEEKESGGDAEDKQPLRRRKG